MRGQKETAVISDEMVESIATHYRHAVEKHPYFCDVLLPFPYDVLIAEDAIDEIREGLILRRTDIKDLVAAKKLTPDVLLKCEQYEVYEAIARKDTAAAVDECYDCIAVLLRMIDVLEGRQPLGKPDDGKKGDVQ